MSNSSQTFLGLPCGCNAGWGKQSWMKLIHWSLIKMGRQGNKKILLNTECFVLYGDGL